MDDGVGKGQIDRGRRLGQTRWRKHQFRHAARDHFSAVQANPLGQARALVAVENPVTLKKAADDVVARGLSVRETEALVRRLNAPPAPPAVVVKDVHTREAEDVLKLALGTRVRIVRKGKGGKVEIDFVSEDELNRIYEHITDTR